MFEYFDNQDELYKIKDALTTRGRDGDIEEKQNIVIQHWSQKLERERKQI